MNNNGIAVNKEEIISKCRILLDAYKSGRLGYTRMPEDSNPGFSKDKHELQLAYFTLPMSLNYQRDSYKLWDSALNAFKDYECKIIFDVKESALMDSGKLRHFLLKHKVALQPNKHISTWQTISKTVFNNWSSFQGLLKSADNDYLKLKQIIQKEYKQGFPYLSGPKIFNYWCFILKSYGNVDLKNSEFIEIAPDTHVTKCSVLLGVIAKEEAEKLSKEQISERWRILLKGSGINPIDMHPPLWFWSRNDFKFKLDSA